MRIVRVWVAAAAVLGAVLPCIDVDAGITLGAYLPGVDSYAGDIASFNQGTGKTHAIILFYRSISGTAPDDTFLLDQCMIAGAIPFVNCTALWPYSGIIAGGYDAYFQTMARAFKGFGGRILMTLDSEMNLSQNPTLFLQMWQRVHNIFAQEGASNVEWVWSPAYASSVDYNLFYPGDTYVDWVGTEGFCWKDSSTAASLFTSILTAFAQRYPKKPAIISYMGADKNSVSEKAQWITNAYASLTNYNNLKAVVWWNDIGTDITGSKDFRVYKTSYPPGAVPVEVTNAYKNAIASAAYLSTLPPLSELSPGGGGSAGLSCSLNPSSVTRGNAFTLSYSITGISQPVDGYLAAVLPNGSMLVADENLNWSGSITPVARKFNPGGNASGSLSFTVPGTVDTGTYIFEAVLVPAGARVTDSANWMGSGLWSSPLVVR